MLDKLIKKAIKHVTEGQFDPWSLNDPIAVQTQWTPLSKSGSNFRTHKITAVSLNRLELKSTLGMKLFSLIFLLVGSAMVVYFFHKYFPFNQADFELKNSLLLIVGLLFGGAGLYLVYESLPVTVFDKHEGAFWKRKFSLAKKTDTEGKSDVFSLDDIHALQIISEVCGSNDKAYYSYELNLVFKDAQRCNVEDHGSAFGIKRDANKLAEFLDVPVWNAL